MYTISSQTSSSEKMTYNKNINKLLIPPLLVLIIITWRHVSFDRTANLVYTLGYTAMFFAGESGFSELCEDKRIIRLHNGAHMIDATDDAVHMFDQIDGGGKENGQIDDSDIKKDGQISVEELETAITILLSGVNMPVQKDSLDTKKRFGRFIFYALNKNNDQQVDVNEFVIGWSTFVGIVFGELDKDGDLKISDSELPKCNFKQNQELFMLMTTLDDCNLREG